jgi:hypothetical protein
MRKWLIGVVAALGAATCVTAASAFGTAQTRPKWVTVTPSGAFGPAPLVFGSASDRGWIGFDPGSGRIALASLRDVGGKLTVARAPALQTSGETARIIGSNLVYREQLRADLRTAPLLQNGMVGPPSALANDPEKVPPQQYLPQVADGVQVGDRMVWLLGGGTGFGKSYMWACCSSTGGLSNLTRFVDQKRGMLFAQLGLDAAGRLWLTWLDHGRAVLGAVRMLELDPATLLPRTTAALGVPGSDTSTGLKLICAAECRVVMSRLRGDIVSWSPGEHAPARLASGTRTDPSNLLDASYRSGGVAVAYSRTRSIGALRNSVIAIRVARGDAHGAHARTVGSVDLPSVINPRDYDNTFMNQANYGTFTSDGLVFFAAYDGDRGTRVLGGVIAVAK